jgi:hypothetical protein
MKRPQLQDLATRLPEKYVMQKPGVSYKASYCSHGDIQQMLLAKVGPTDQRVIEKIYANDGKTVQGVILEMIFEIDGSRTTIHEAGECERPGDNNALNLKMSISDAVKRCCFRTSLGLELYTDNYALDTVLESRNAND